MDVVLRQEAFAKRESGQIAVVMVGVLGLVVAAIVGVALIGNAVIHRARARTAADTVALATAIDSEAGTHLVDWYGDRGTVVERSPTRVLARSGPSQAAAWADTTVGLQSAGPAVVAVIARAEQVLGQTLRTTRSGPIWVEMGAEAAVRFAPVAGDFGMCEVQHPDSISAGRRFELC